MHERLLALGLGAVCLLAVSPAGAQDDAADAEDFYSRSGVYLLGQFTNNIGTFRSPEPAVRTSAGEYSTGAAGALGYRINRYVAAELAGDWIAGWKVRVAGESKKLVGGTYGANVKGYLKGGRLQPYALVGLGATFMEVRNTSGFDLSGAEWDLGIRLALGVDWYLTEELGLNFAPGVVIPVGFSREVGELDYLSIAIGAFLRFGGD